MENNTGNQGNQTAQQEGNPAEQGNANGNGSQGERMFTQAEVNALINKRYANPFCTLPFKCLYCSILSFLQSGKKEAQSSMKSSLKISMPVT